MPLHKARYIHHRYFGPTENLQAFTAKISPSDQEGMVELQVTFCNKKDHFCRKEGRKQCDKAPVFVIPVYNLPTRLTEFAYHTLGYPKMKLNKEDANQFAWIWKYFL